MAGIQPIVPCLWFDSQAEEAARYYTSIFKNSKIGTISRYGEAGREVHKRPAGSVMTVDFELNGQPFTALNAGPVFKFNEAISFQIMCRTQEEIDHYWNKLGAGGDKEAQAVRLGQGQVRPVLAGRADRAGRDDGRSGPGKGRSGHGGNVADEEARHRGAGAGVRRRNRRQPAVAGSRLQR